MQAGHIGCKPVIPDLRRCPNRACGPSETRACHNREMMRGLRIEPERERANESRISRHVRIINTRALPRLWARQVAVADPIGKGMVALSRHCEERLVRR